MFVSVLISYSVRPRLYGEKLSPVKGSPSHPRCPGRANFSYISLQNLRNRLYEKQKVGSARRVTRMAWSPSLDGRVTLLAAPTFLHIKHVPFIRRKVVPDQRVALPAESTLASVYMRKKLTPLLKSKAGRAYSDRSFRLDRVDPAGRAETVHCYPRNVDRYCT